MGIIYYNQNLYSIAKSHFDKSREISEKIYGENSYKLSGVLKNTANYYFKTD